MRRTQEKKAERKRRRKVCCRGQILGHTVKNCMTVICTDGALSISIGERASNMELTLFCGQLHFSLSKINLLQT